MLKSFLSKFCDIASISTVSFCSDALSLNFSVVAVFINDVSSTYASPILDISVPVGVSSLKQLYFTAIDHIIGFKTATQIDGEAQLPWPVPKMRLSASDWYDLADIPWPVLIWYTVLFKIVVSIFAAVRGRPRRLQFIMAWGGTILS